MNLLLDTHAFLWWITGARMTAQARDHIADPANTVVLSAISVWEISIKRALGKLRLPGSVVEHARAGGFGELAVSSAHAEHAGALPPHHRDPFDRLLIAQAQLDRFTIVTRDARFATYEVPIVGC